MRLATSTASGVPSAESWHGAEPLWRVVPKRDEAGGHLADFMMFAPSLRGASAPVMQAHLDALRGVLARFEDVVVFADYNLALHLLWVSHRCRPGVMSVLVAALRHELPALKLVGHNPWAGEA